jgi:tetratricopeptide (TPR) repeat protein
MMVCAQARQKEFKHYRPAAPLLLLLCALLPATLLAASRGDSSRGPSSHVCAKHVSALEAALQREDQALAQRAISDFFSKERAAPLKRCFLFHAAVAFHSLGQSSTCWTMFAAFFDSFPGHNSTISAGSAYAAAYAKGGTCGAVEGHVDAAAALLQHAVRLHPQDSQSWNNLANVYRSMGLTQKALDA